MPPPRFDGAVTRLLGDHAPVGLVATDADWRIIACNAAVSTMTGHDPAELVGRSLGDLMTTASKVLHQARYAADLARSGALTEVALELVHRDGSRVPVLLHVSAVSDARMPSVAHVTAFASAVDRRSHERELLAARQRAEASERQMARLHGATRRLAAAETPREVDAALGAHQEEAAAAGGAGRAEAAAVALAADQARRRIAMLARLQAEARSDPLTGLANRRAFDDQLQQLLLDRRRTGDPLTLLFIDLDDFKGVNDRHGHLVGDQLLVSVADALRQVVRASDAVARIGGDEFVVLSRQPRDRDAAEVMRLRVEQRIGEVVAEGGGGVSVGLVHLGPGAPTPGAAELLADVDEAMYRRKRTSRGPAD